MVHRCFRRAVAVCTISGIDLLNFWFADANAKVATISLDDEQAVGTHHSCH